MARHRTRYESWLQTEASHDSLNSVLCCDSGGGGGRRRTDNPKAGCPSSGDCSYAVLRRASRDSRRPEASGSGHRGSIPHLSNKDEGGSAAEAVTLSQGSCRTSYNSSLVAVCVYRDGLANHQLQSSQ